MAGASAGSIAGGIIRALVGWDFPEQRVHEFESGIKDGGNVLSVKETLPNSHLSDDWSVINNPRIKL